MAFPNIFKPEVTEQVIDRINKLTPETKPLWGKMSVSQMLAHLCVSYEMIYENKHPKPNGFTKFILKLFVKDAVVSEKPYKHNSPTASAFVIQDERNFEAEKGRLIDYMHRTQQLGEAAFDGKASHSFGPLTITEWNNLFYKHLDHHLSQFGV